MRVLYSLLSLSLLATGVAAADDQKATVLSEIKSPLVSGRGERGRVPH
jgi:hypothetical protein